MLDINFIRENKELVKNVIKQRAMELDVEELLLADEKKRELVTKVDELRRQRNVAAQKRDIETGKKIKQELDGLEEQLRKEEERFEHLISFFPNIPLEDVPDGGEENNQVLREEGKIPEFEFTPKDHVELGEKLGIIDIPRAAKVSGARFAYLKNEGALLELALVQYAMKKLFDNKFIPIFPPVLIKKEFTEKLGYWNAGGNENYYLINDYEEGDSGDKKVNPLYLIGTGEHAVVPMHSGETFNEEELPKKYAAFSSCFRREVGTGGKDIRGILRVHQFDKVEMVAFVKPEDDQKQLDEMLSLAESFLKEFKIPYRVVKLAKGDISLPAAKTIDLESWIPSQKTYRETHSISTTTDFQARRLKTKFKNKNRESDYVHILNGTALAIGRILIAILENYQQADGSVKIPEVLTAYTGFSEIKV